MYLTLVALSIGTLKFTTTTTNQEMNQDEEQKTLEIKENWYLRNAGIVEKKLTEEINGAPIRAIGCGWIKTGRYSFVEG